MGTKPPAPIIADDVIRYINQIVEMAKLIVDNVEPEDAVFLQWFGSARYYPYVIKVNAVFAQNDPDINYHHIENPGAEYLYKDNGEPPVIKLFQVWRRLYPLLETPLNFPSRDINDLNAMLYTRQGLILHELFHFVGDPAIYDPVMPEGKDSLAAFQGSSIVDVPVYAAARSNEDRNFMMENLERAKTEELDSIYAYGVEPCLVLPQLTLGPLYATHNADSYTAFTFAVLTGWNLDQNWVPTYGPSVAEYQRATKRDPLAKTRPPFRDMGRDSVIVANCNLVNTNYYFILALIRDSSLLSHSLEEMQKARIDTGNEDRLPCFDYNILSKQPFLQSALNETLRTEVTSLIALTVERNYEVDGYTIPKDALACVSIAVEHNNKGSWESREGAASHPVEQFWPERFLKAGEADGKCPGQGRALNMSGLESTFIPFGVGHYMCPGRHFAIVTRTILSTAAMFLTAFEIRPGRWDSGRCPLRLTEEAYLNYNSMEQSKDLG
ncbi:hypothetical protein HYFRA_00010571 [Hymenoscyphus fraxineus]|uniref:Cytochrome P450 n=1 Tax=Hymenoscyphus fraxineus TaxID=746836 RepID=A0A9N9L8N0_9HELO|nr:hypothetical protein HYFRA_00010571 [Hymenoscyphus fraxineus]